MKADNKKFVKQMLRTSVDNYERYIAETRNQIVTFKDDLKMVEEELVKVKAALEDLKQDD